MDFVPKVKIDVVIPDRLPEATMAAIVKPVRTGQIGDGKLFVSNLEEAVRVRTLERGEAAI